MTIEVAITIPAPVARVWAVIEPIEEHVRWMTDAERITFTSSQRSGVGTTFDCVTKVGPFRTNDRMVVTAWEPERCIAIEHRGLIAGEGVFTLQATADSATRFTWTEQLRFPWWLGGAAGAYMAAPVLRRVWRGNLEALRRLVASAG